MDYLRSSVMHLLRGPLLYTPQGWVVLATAAIGWGFASVAWVTGLSIFGEQLTGKELTLALVWPLLVFMFYLNLCAPHFKASRSHTAHLTVSALALPCYMIFEAWQF
jgi:hypothetical protein